MSEPITALPSVAILGAGSMGGAILQGLLSVGLDRSSVRVTTRSEASAAELREQGVEVRASEVDSSANGWAVENADVVILGVKPVGIRALAAEVRPSIGAHAVVVSVAAGIRIASIEAELAEGAAVVRAMPNTPSTVGRGVTGIAAGAAAGAEQVALVRRVFETVGSVHQVDESQIDALTSISGSGPAYVFLFIEELTRAGIARGLEPELAAALASETFAGASALLASSDVGPSELRRRVTSPGGTTAKAIETFEARGIGSIFDAATAAAAARAAEMAGPA